MLSFLIASLILPLGTLADDCTIVKTAWKSMGKKAVKSSINCCTMGGVTCSGGYVTKISWQSEDLKGSIPDSLGDLNQLIELNLNYNKLSGPIPASLGNLALLQHLSLGYNQLTGTIPNSLGNLAQLRELGLYNNQLNGNIPPSLGNLNQLTKMILCSNQLSGSIPTSLGNLAQLTQLVLHFNQLSGVIPSSLGYLSQLRELVLHSNQFTGSIPSSLGNLAQLNYLYLYSNQLSGPIPPSLGNLVNLIYLGLHLNQLSDTIPPSLGNLNQLKYMYLHNNQLTGVPSSLSNLNLRHIVLLPNPMPLIPYDIIVKNPVSTMSAQNLTTFLATSKLVKREQLSSVATLTTDQLLKMCPLNYVANQDILAGCVAGIVYFCQGQTDLTQCQRYYDTVFSYSIFAPIGANCPAWKYGPYSSKCTNAVNSLSVNLAYTTVNKEFASFFAKTLFTDKTYAPCINTATVKCTW